MLIDITLSASRLQQCFHLLALLLLGLLICISGLSWLATVVAIGLLCLLDRWLAGINSKNQITAAWQGDSQTWYWQRQQGKRQTGQLVKIRRMGLLIHLTLKETVCPQTTPLTIWRDQVSAEQWRHLCVLSALNHSQQNLS